MLATLAAFAMLATFAMFAVLLCLGLFAMFALFAFASGNHISCCFCMYMADQLTQILYDAIYLTNHINSLKAIVEL